MNNLPLQVAGYRFKKAILTEKRSSKYSYALYIDEAGHKAFAKIWQGRRIDRNYLFLKNEIAAYKLLSTVNPKSVANRFTVRLPKYISSLKTSSQLLMLLEYVPGHHLGSISPVDEADLFEQILKYLDTVNGQLDLRNTRLTYRGPGYICAIVPLITLKALVRHPGYWREIINGVLYFLSCLPQLISDNQLAFSHRDLGQWNVLVDNNTVYIFDLQLAALAHPLLDLAILVLKMWPNRKFIQHFLKSSLVHSRISSRRIFSGLAVYQAVYDLSLPDGGSPSVALDYLSYFTKPNYAYQIAR